MGRGMVGSMGEWERSSFDPRFTPSRKWISYFPVGKLIAGTNTSGVGSSDQNGSRILLWRLHGLVRFTPFTANRYCVCCRDCMDLSAKSASE